MAFVKFPKNVKMYGLLEARWMSQGPLWTSRSLTAINKLTDHRMNMCIGKRSPRATFDGNMKRQNNVVRSLRTSSFLIETNVLMNKGSIMKSDSLPKSSVITQSKFSTTTCPLSQKYKNQDFLLKHFWKVRFSTMLESLKGEQWLHDCLNLAETQVHTIQNLEVLNRDELHQVLLMKTEEEIVQLFAAALNMKTKETFLFELEKYFCLNLTWSYASAMQVLEYSSIGKARYTCSLLNTNFFEHIIQDFEKFANDVSFITSVCLISSISNGKDKNVTSVLHKVYNQVSRIASEFSLEQLTIVLNAFVYQRILLPMTCKRTISRSAQDKLLMKVNSEAAVEDISITVLLNFVVQQKWTDNKFFYLLGNFLCKPQEINRLKNVDFTSKIVSAYAKCRIVHKNLMSAVIDILTNTTFVENSLTRHKSIGLLFWSFSQLAYSESSHPELYASLTRLWLSTRDVRRGIDPIKYRQQASALEMLSSCVVGGYLPTEVMKAIFVEDIAKNIAGRAVDDLGKKFQPLVIQTSLDIEHPNYKGKLSDSTMEYIKQEFSKSNPGWTPDKQKLDKIVKTLRGIYGDDCVHSRLILPFCVLPCIEMWIDKKTNSPIKFTPVPYQELVKESQCKSGESQDIRKVVVSFISSPKMLRVMHSDARVLRTPVGLELFRKRLLEKLGFEVIFIYKDAGEMMKSITDSIFDKHNIDQEEDIDKRLVKSVAIIMMIYTRRLPRETTYRNLNGMDKIILEALLGVKAIPQKALDFPTFILYKSYTPVCAGLSILSLKDNKASIKRLNKVLLPSGIRVIDIIDTSEEFDAVQSRDEQTYTYVLPSFLCAPKDATATQKYRIPEETFNQLSALVKKFKGTHSFHNYGSPSWVDESVIAVKCIEDIYCKTPIVKGNEELIEIVMKGSYFTPRMLKKIIGMTVAVMKGHFGDEIIERSYQTGKMFVPQAPDNGLLLESVNYSTYNKKHADEFPPVDTSRYKDEINKSREHVLQQMALSLRKHKLQKWLDGLQNMDKVRKDHMFLK